MSKTWKQAKHLKSPVNRSKKVIEQRRAQEAELEARETAHSVYTQKNYLNIYVYDPTEDGPEVWTIRSILSHCGDELSA
jgi:hypothetical protein